MHRKKGPEHLLRTVGLLLLMGYCTLHKDQLLSLITL
jgi:hypothetical protein